MTAWLIRPRDPLIFRDGRPFTADPGARATTLPFPFPSTLAGAARTLAGTDSQTGTFDDSRIDDLLRKQIRGPLLVEISADGGIERFYAPAPADALLLKDDDDASRVIRQWLRPVNLKDVITDFGALLRIVGPHKARKEKVHPKRPSFWRWEDYEKWLLAPPTEDEIDNVATWGLHGLPQEYRTHVRIAAETQTADAGGLFVTSGLEFVQADTQDGQPALHTVTEFGLVLETDAPISARWGFLGGERRIAGWKQTPTGLPTCPDAIRERIVTEKHCRLVLLTPADFEAGYRPRWALNQAGVQAQVVAAAVPRYQTVSGWDYNEGKPKATRRLAPAGSVYYLKLEGDAQAIGAFVDALWMHNISDDAQARRDGFGLAVLGTWDGEIKEMEVSNA